MSSHLAPSAVICLGLVVLAVRSYFARLQFQRRFIDLVRRGYVTPVFDLGQSNSQPLPFSQPIPELNEAVVLKARARRLVNPAKWADVQVRLDSPHPLFWTYLSNGIVPSLLQPLVLTSAPKASTSTTTLISFFDRSSFFRNRRSDLRTQRAPGLISTPSAPQSNAGRKGNPLSTTSVSKETRTPPPAPDTVQAAFLIAMPMPPRQAVEAIPQPAGMELHLGTVQAEWDRASCPLPRAATPPPVLSPSQPSLQSTMPLAQSSFPIFPQYVQGGASILPSPPLSTSQVQLHRLPVQSRSSLATERPTRDTSRNPSTLNFAPNSEMPQS